MTADTLVHHVPGTPWTRAAMLDLLDRSNVAVERALLVLYARQTPEERTEKATTQHNGAGWGLVDAEFLTSCAEQVEWKRRHDNAPEGQRLTDNQMKYARPKVKKYVGQLVEVANQRLGFQTPKEPRKPRKKKNPETQEQP